MITILSPAKTLDFEKGQALKKHTLPDFREEAKELVENLRQYTVDELMDLMNVSRDIAELNYQRFIRFSNQFNKENARQAVLAFRGEVYRGLDADSLKERELLYAQDHVRILSGLYGVLKPLDYLQAYRLEMGTNLENNKGNNLYDFWGIKITENLNRDIKKQKEKVLVNLASQEYYKAIKPGKIEGKIITPVFKESKGDSFRVIAVYAKKARGLMTRFIIQNKIEEPEELKAFDLEGYMYNDQLSKNGELVFTR